MDAVKCKGWVDIMDINQITYSLKLAETLNFTQVARRSGITKPSLTNSIRELEKDLGG
ncbi:MAG: LysR family hydrogen peroxide-inducible transcriptional activator [Yoonia sp.]|jgi:LysR family hydrogen peroxide-inducible transcriptional activator